MIPQGKGYTVPGICLSKLGEYTYDFYSGKTCTRNHSTPRLENGAIRFANRNGHPHYSTAVIRLILSPGQEVIWPMVVFFLSPGHLLAFLSSSPSTPGASTTWNSGFLPGCALELQREIKKQTKQKISTWRPHSAQVIQNLCSV